MTYLNRCGIAGVAIGAGLLIAQTPAPAFEVATIKS
jgi:hypothetical protein